MYRCVEMNFLAVDSKLIISLIIPMDLGFFVSGSDNYDKCQSSVRTLARISKDIGTHH